MYSANLIEKCSLCLDFTMSEQFVNSSQSFAISANVVLDDLDPLTIASRSAAKASRLVGKPLFYVLPFPADWITAFVTVIPGAVLVFIGGHVSHQ